MSVEAPPRPSPSGPAGVPPAAPPGTVRRAPSRTLLAAETAVVGLGLVTAVTYWRVFTGWAFAPTLVVAAIASALLAIGMRRSGWRLIPSATVSVVAGAVAVGLLRYPGTTVWGVLPTRATWVAAVADLRDAWAQFDVVEAPVPAEGGFLLAALVATWVAAFVADTFAFRARVGFETIVPHAVPFVFVTALAADRMRLLAAALFFCAALVTLLLHRTWGQEAAAGWLSTRPHGVVGDLLGRALLLLVTAAVLAAGFGPRLPLATGDRLFDVTPGSGGGGGSRVTLSPLVDIRGRIAGQSLTEAFTVVSSVPAYWRLTSLDEFTGEIWRAENEFRPTRGPLPSPPDRAGREVTQVFTITGLTGIWLPAAATPVRIEGIDGVSYDPQSASLVTQDDTASGTRYAVTSLLPGHTPEELRAADGPVPEAIARRYLQLPADFPEEFRAEALRIAGAAGTTYDRALTLQNHFRANFRYDLSFRQGHDENAIAQFLRERRGYCEQFAGTFAAFARALGIPSRVAVGFTAGERLAADRYRVLGKHAHAWPEVWIAGVGWVAFEPTPQRGAPGAESYTGVPAQQVDDVAEDDPTTTPTTVAPGGPTTTTVPEIFPGGTLPDDIALPGIDVPTGGQLPTTGSDGGWAGTLARTLVTLTALAALWGVGVPAMRAARRQRRRQRHLALLVVLRREARLGPHHNVLPATGSRWPGSRPPRRCPGPGCHPVRRRRPWSTPIGSGPTRSSTVRRSVRWPRRSAPHGTAPISCPRTGPQPPTRWPRRYQHTSIRSRRPGCGGVSGGIPGTSSSAGADRRTGRPPRAPDHPSLRRNRLRIRSPAEPKLKRAVFIDVVICCMPARPSLRALRSITKAAASMARNPAKAITKWICSVTRRNARPATNPSAAHLMFRNAWRYSVVWLTVSANAGSLS